MEKNASKEWDEAKALIPEPLTPLYDAEWLNDCSETLYQSGSHLHKVVSKITKEVASKLETHIAYTNSEQRKQATYALLGLRYVTDNISHAELYDPTKLEKLSSEEREALNEECKALILENSSRTKEHLGFSQNLSRYSPETPLGSFLRASGTVLREGVEKQLKDGKRIKIKMAAKEKAKRTFTFDGHAVEIWETRADVLAQALVEVTHHEPERIQALLRSFRELQMALPAPVSNLLKKQFLLRKEKQNFVLGSNLKLVERKWREEFVKRVHHNTIALQVDRAIKSPLWQQIDNAVIEIYGRVPSMAPHDTDEHQLEASGVLNILQVYNKVFDPILVFWLFPLQINLGSAIHGTDCHVMELAMYLDLVHRHCIPPIAAVFAMADQVANMWKDWDRNLVKHVEEALTKNVWINIKVKNTPM